MPFPPTPLALGQLVVDASRRALATGALVSIATRETVLCDGDATYLVRVVEQLARKSAANLPATTAAQSTSPFAPSNSPASPNVPRNPFLPYDRELFVTDLPPHHVCLLNKFNVVDHHVLLVTKQFERQTSPLTAGDFAALANCMASPDSFSNGLGFYNGGPTAGASQPHKHLQWIPVPPGDFPLVPHIDRAAEIGQSSSPSLPFAHAIEQFELGSTYRAAKGDFFTVGKQIEDVYRRLLARVGIETPDSRLAEPLDLPPYNLLITQKWLMVVPRRQEHFEDISLNSLAFVGALLVKDDAQWRRLREAGPKTALATVAPPLATSRATGG